MTDRTATPRVGLIGGSGLYTLPGLRVQEEARLPTPFGDPSDAFVLGEMSGVPVVFLARHGRGHRIAPSEINFRANLWGMKRLGVDAVLSVSACGSMKEQYRPTDVVLPDQLIDRTTRRVSTFFGDGCVAHVSLAHPICASLHETLRAAAASLGAVVHAKGTYIGIEGPQFSTLAESRLYRSWDVDVIGMTNVQEAKLAREAEICYATMNLVTDYDCWNEAEQAVTVDAILGVLEANADAANRILARAVEQVDRGRGCACRDALRFALLTRREDVPEETRRRLSLLTEKYWS
jgi:5'-methylthioadenosine phosphorylase